MALTKPLPVFVRWLPLVTSKNALRSILFLVVSFIFSAIITIFFLENEFLALFFLIIYLGAIVILFLFVIILFLFVVMMLDISRLWELFF